MEPDLDFVQIDQQLVDQAVKAMDAAKSRRLKVVTAESRTDGLIATVLTEAPGAAEYFDGGFITYFGLSDQAWLLEPPTTTPAALQLTPRPVPNSASH
jgi:hypothetical protein